MWKWHVCGVLLLATMLNYMDRQTLSQTAADISAELGLSNSQYAWLETGFGLAFAAGALGTGLLADVIPIRWMYPFVVLGWSFAGFATAYADRIGGVAGRVWRAAGGGPVEFDGLSQSASQTFLGLLVCRVALGVFEAGQWPCALITTQRLLTQKERTFGNSLLQSGASLGAVVTPLVVQWLVTDQVGSWRAPFAVIGSMGALWIIPWLMLVGPRDLDLPAQATINAVQSDAGYGPRDRLDRRSFWRRFAALVCVVITINLTWHYFRAWLPKYLREFLSYDRTTVNYFTSGFYIATDAGCIAVGVATHWLARKGYEVHRVRMQLFVGCALLTALGVVAARLPRGYPVLLVLLVIGFGALGLFPIYYSLAQELSMKNQGKITGSLGATTWVATALMQKWAGEIIDQTGSHVAIMTIAGLLPLAGALAIYVLWENAPPARNTDST